MQRKKQKIAIAYIITKLELGGAQKVCLTLYQGMQQHMPTYLFTSKGTLSDSIIDETVVYLESLKRELHVNFLLRELKTFFTLIKHLRTIKKNTDVFIVHTHSTKAGILGRWAAFFAGAHRVHTVHGFAFHDHQPWPQWFLIWAIEWITSFITEHAIFVSMYDTHYAKKKLLYFKNFSLVRAAVNMDPFKEFLKINKPIYIKSPAEALSYEHFPFIFGTIACFKPQKNLLELLQAFKRIHAQNKNTRLEIIGDGQQRQQLETFIYEHSLEHVITLHGWCKQVAPIMSKWHAFVLSSLWEGLPCAIIEARLLKLPIISYATGGIPDVIQSGVNGILVEQKNWQALADAMLAIVIDKKLYNKLSAYQDNLNDFDHRVMLDKHHTIYQSFFPTN